MTHLNADNIGAIDAYSAISKVRDMIGWKIFDKRVGEIADELMVQLADIKLKDNKPKYNRRDLVAHQ